MLIFQVSKGVVFLSSLAESTSRAKNLEESVRFEEVWYINSNIFVVACFTCSHKLSKQFLWSYLITFSLRLLFFDWWFCFLAHRCCDLLRIFVPRLVRCRVWSSWISFNFIVMHLICSYMIILVSEQPSD